MSFGGNGIRSSLTSQSPGFVTMRGTAAILVLLETGMVITPDAHWAQLPWRLGVESSLALRVRFRATMETGCRVESHIEG